MKVIIIGGGRSLYFLAQTFRKKGHAVTIINRDAAECTKLAQQIDATIVHGDGSDQRILEEAGARAAAVVLAATPSDPDNLIACQLAKTRFTVPRAIALVNDPDNQSIFRQLGIDAISTALTVASLIEQRATLDQVTDLIPAGDGKVTISEVTLTESFSFAGRPVAEIEFPRDALIAVVIRNGETVIPRGDTELRVGDRVLLVTLSDSHERALNILTGE
ncbi:MAG: NAD-binding protein [Planctomycetes bacterium]|nr:NAD-binding protein [Planctomycetota bacterium]